MYVATYCWVFWTEGALSSGCSVTDYCPLILECPAVMILLGLLGTRSRPVSHIEIASKSNWSWHVDSTEGIRGRRPRPTSLGRLKRALSAATDTIFASPAGGRPRALRPEPPQAAGRNKNSGEFLSRRRRTFLRVPRHRLQSTDSGVSGWYRFCWGCSGRDLDVLSP